MEKDLLQYDEFTKKESTFCQEYHRFGYYQQSVLEDLDVLKTNLKQLVSDGSEQGSHFMPSLEMAEQCAESFQTGLNAIGDSLGLIRGLPGRLILEKVVARKDDDGMSLNRASMIVHKDALKIFTLVQQHFQIVNFTDKTMLDESPSIILALKLPKWERAAPLASLELKWPNWIKAPLEKECPVCGIFPAMLQRRHLSDVKYNMLKKQFTVSVFGKRCHYDIVSVNNYDQRFREKRFFEQDVGKLIPLRHPNIVRIIGIVQEPHELGYITEDLSDFDLLSELLLLSKFIAEGDVKCESFKRDSILLVCEALIYMHKHGAVHRDVRSANVVCIPDLQKREYLIKLSGFGLDRALSHNVITLNFQAPETFQDQRRFQPSADVYSFGGLLIEVFALCRPWDKEEDDLSLIEKVKSGMLPPELEDIKDMDIRNLARECLQHDPYQRPSMQQIHNVLTTLFSKVTYCDDEGCWQHSKCSLHAVKPTDFFQ